MYSTVIVADTDAFWAELCQRVLEQCGFRVSTAGNAAECLKQVRRMRPDVVIVDAAMFEAGLRLRDLHENRGETLVFAAGAMPPDSLSTLSGVSGRRCLQKPFRMNTLLTRLRQELAACASASLPAPGR